MLLNLQLFVQETHEANKEIPYHFSNFVTENS